MIGSILDAHENMIVGLELNVLRYIKLGFSRNQILCLILNNSKHHAKKGRSWMGYSYHVKDQWQGKFSRLLVLGDKKGGMTSRILYYYPDLLTKAQKRLGCKIRFIHVIRNPYDIITTRARHGKTKDLELDEKIIDNTIDNFFMDVESVNRLKMLEQSEIFDLRFENFIMKPEESLKNLCNFLGVKTTGEYLKSCKEIIYETPHKSRFEYDWSPELIRKVNAEIQKYPFLKDYSFRE